MKPLEQLYARSPVAIQNLMVSGYGLLLWWRRFAGPMHGRLVKELAEWERLSREQVQWRQKVALQRLVHHAAQKVPYYRALFARLDIEPGRIDSVDALQQIPLLDKHRVQRAPQAFIADGAGARLRVNTSGSTGSPLTVHCDRAALLRNYAHFTRLRERLGIGARSRCATLAGRTVVEPNRTRPPFWRHNLITNSQLYSTYHLTPDTIPSYLEQLQKQRPELIDSYPSALAILAAYAAESDSYQIRPRAIITSSETLLPAQRALIERTFQCRITDQYGSAEMAAFIAQCQHGQYHVWPSYGLVEVLVNGRAARPGETGELVCTGFINPAMPLIRYRIGDSAVVGEPCACGLPYPTLARIEGRLDDVLVTPDGRRVGRLDPVFKGIEDDAFREAQIVQKTLSRVVLRYVPGRRFSDIAVQKVRNELAKRLGPSVKIETEPMEALPRSASGKLKAVVGLRSDTAAGDDEQVGA